jgi:hypothetical protein
MVIKEIKMGFWDNAKKAANLAKKAANLAQKTLEYANEKVMEMNEVKNRLENYSDDELKNIVKDNSFFGGYSSTEKKFAKAILQKRGIDI